MNYAKKRVFIHELGHFIAGKINRDNFGLSGVAKIKLTKHQTKFDEDFIGETIYKVPTGESEVKVLENLPQKIANLVYGCYFQSIYLKTELKKCLDWDNPNANGKIDMNDIISAVTMFDISSEKRSILYPYLEKDYFEQLRSKKKEFISLFNLNPEDFYTEINDYETDINLMKLDKATKEFINSHTKTYLNFILKIEEILDWENISKNK